MLGFLGIKFPTTKMINEFIKYATKTAPIDNSCKVGSVTKNAAENNPNPLNVNRTMYKFPPKALFEPASADC
jgi:phage FluMu protein Com